MNRLVHARARHPGFTLIEILVAILIVMVAASLFIGTYLRAQKRGYDAAAQACGQAIVEAARVYRGIHGALPAVPFSPTVLGGDLTEACSDGGGFRVAAYAVPNTIQLDRFAIESLGPNGDVAFFVNSARGTGFWVYHRGDTFCGTEGCHLNRLIPFSAYGL